jgi:hypothetical protein
MHPSAAVRTLVLAAGMVLAAACASPRQRLQESLDSAASWAATAEMAAAGYAGNSAPRPILRTLVRTTREALAREQETTAAAGEATDRRVGAAAQAIASALADVDDLAAAVEGRDRGRAAAVAERLRARADALRALAQAGR